MPTLKTLRNIYFVVVAHGSRRFFTGGGPFITLTRAADVASHIAGQQIADWEQLALNKKRRGPRPTVTVMQALQMWEPTPTEEPISVSTIHQA